MDSGMLSASPSWYCSRVSDCHAKGIFVYGAKNSLYLLDITGDSPQYQGFVTVHKDRVVGVSLCHQVTDRIVCCTISDDKKVRIWDVDKKELKEEHQYHKNMPTAVHWSRKTEDLIISGDERGELIVWNLATRTVQQYMPEKGHVFCLEWSPVNPNVVAVGYKTGSIVLFDVQRRGQVVQRLRGHDEEVHCVRWCPSPGENIRIRQDGETVDKGSESMDLGPVGHLLASGSRDRTIRIWSTSTGRALQTLKLPTNTGFRRRNEEQFSGRDRVWATLDWLPDQPRQLLTSTHGGELLHWDLCQPGKQKWDVFGGLGHTRIIFNVAIFNNKACTISMDRTIVVWDIERRNSSHILPTLGGFAYALVSSPLNPGRMAIGVGDNMIRVWNLSNASNTYDVTTHWQGIKSKVTCLSWHPEKEGLLAYGTDDGRVGIADVLSGKSPFISSTYHKRTVYVVAWGPNCPFPEDQASVNPLMLYSCGDGVVLLHNPKKLDKEASNFCLAINTANGPNYKGTSRSEISWKPDNSVVALGNEDGTVDVYGSKDLRLLCSIHVHHKIVNVCRWHPEYLVQSTEPSSCRFWLATGSNDGAIQVLDLQKELENNTDEISVITESFCQLEGHTNRVTGLSWSVHEEGMLASSSYDGTAQVWNVKASEGVANFRGHYGRVMNVLWSAVDPHVIYSGGDDFTVKFWRSDKQEQKLPPKVTGKKNKAKKNPSAVNAPPQLTTGQTVENTKSAVKAEAGKIAGNVDMDEINRLIEERKKELLQKQQQEPGKREVTKVVHEETVEDNIEQPKSQPLMVQIGAGKKDGQKEGKHRRKAKALFPVFSSAENRGKTGLLQDCVDLTSHVFNEKEQNGNGALGENLSHLGVYTDRRNTYQSIDKEVKCHEENGNFEQQLYLDMWTGNISGVLERAKNNHQLNDWIVALAPLASPKTWRETCASYAQILANDGHIHKAVTYLLAAKMVNEAISLLTSQKLYKEAVHLAQARLSPADPLRTSLYQQWASHLMTEGNFEQAAKCFLAIKNPIEAAKALTRRQDLLAWKTAIQVTLIGGEHSACQTYVVRYMQECMLKYKWIMAFEIAQLTNITKWLCVPVIVHEALVQSLVMLGLYKLEQAPEPSSIQSPCAKKLPRFLVNPQKASALCPWSVFLKDGQSLSLHIISRWLKELSLDLDRDQLNKCIALLKQVRETKQSNTQEKQVLIVACLEVSLGLLGLLQCDMDSATYWLTTAMATCHSTGRLKLLQGLCQTLLPLGPESLPQLQQQVTALRLAAEGDPVGVQAADLSRRPSVALELEKAGEDAKDYVIGNNTEMCTSVDCLAAYFYTAVLHYLESSRMEHVIVENNGAVHISENGENGDGASVGESVDVPTDAEDADQRENGSVGAEAQDDNSSRLIRLSHYLLWESQARRKALLSCIENIRSQLSATLKDGEALDEVVNSLEIPRVLSRAASGEYLPMTPVKMSREGSFNPGGGDFLERSFAGSECEWVDMKDSSHISNGLLNDSSSVAPDLSHSMSTSSIQTRIYTRAHSIFSDLSQSVLLSGASMAAEEDDVVEQDGATQEPNSSVPTKNDFSADGIETIENIKSDSQAAAAVNGGVTERDEPLTVTFCLGTAEGDVTDETSTKPTESALSVDQWQDQPENWQDMPVDQRYSLPDIPPAFLVQELKFADQQLQILNSKLPANCPFPDVLESCRMLLKLAPGGSDEESFRSSLQDWGLSHSYLVEHRSLFSTLKGPQIADNKPDN